MPTMRNTHTVQVNKQASVRLTSSLGALTHIGSREWALSNPNGEVMLLKLLRKLMMVL